MNELIAVFRNEINLGFFVKVSSFLLYLEFDLVSVLMCMVLNYCVKKGSTRCSLLDLLFRFYKTYGTEGTGC